MFVARMTQPGSVSGGVRVEPKLSITFVTYLLRPEVISRLLPLKVITASNYF